MPGGEMQLVAMGAADFFLTGNPSITFFKIVYRRHTNYATEYIILPFDKIPTFNPLSHTDVSCKINRNADLLYDTYLVYDLPAIYTTDDIQFGWVEDVGTKIIDEISIRADGQILDRQYGQWMKLWSDLSLTESKKRSFKKMVASEEKLYSTGNTPDLNAETTEKLVFPAKRLYIPLMFWFCTNPGLSIPLIAMQYCELYIDCRYTMLNELIRFGNPMISPKKMFSDNELSETNQKIKQKLLAEGWDQTNIFYKFTKYWKQNSYLVANYVYLGNDERKIFAQASHEYLIHQIQRRVYMGLKIGRNTLDLKLYHPVKEIIWVLQRSDVDMSNTWYNFTALNDPQSLEYLEKLRGANCIELYDPTLLNHLTTPPVKKYLSELYNNYFGEKNIENIHNYLFDYYSIMSGAELQFNGLNRMEFFDKSFYEYLQPYKYHTNTGKRGLYCLSFAFYPEQEQPSGTCNMSRIPKQQLIVEIFDTFEKTDKFNLYLYAYNYNVFRIMGGIGQIVFSN